MSLNTASAYPSENQINALVVLMNAGQWVQVLPLAHQMAQNFPTLSFGWAMLGAALRAEGRHEEALDPAREVVRLAPTEPESHLNLGNVLQDLDQHDEAIACFEHAIALNKSFVPAIYNLANLLTRMGRCEEALTHYRQAMRLVPNAPEINFNAALASKAAGHREEAHDLLKKVIATNPQFTPALRELGSIEQQLGNTDAAWDCYSKALQIDPNDVELLALSSELLMGFKQYKEALLIALQWATLAPDSAIAHQRVGKLQRADGQPLNAIASFERALVLKADDINGLVELGLTLQQLNRYQEAATTYRRALNLNPDASLLYTNLFFVMVHDESVSVSDLQELLAKFSEKCETPFESTWPKHPNSRDPDKKINVGFVSGDFRNHPVVKIFMPLLKPLSTMPDMVLHAFYTHGESDVMTQTIKGHFAHWHEVSRLNEVELAQEIQRQNIDILVDLSGHTGHNRLTAFARKPAPVQVSWLGFPGSTGLKAMDYYLADEKLYPPGLMDSQFTEKMVYLPATNPFLTSEFAPPVNALPALANGYLTFASFNRPSKISRFTVGLWAALLKALPDAKLIIGGVAHVDDIVDRLQSWFEEEGVSGHRISYLPRGGIAEYLAWHHQVDMCLDTFPYNGGTTTTNALSMGVPTLTMTGPLPHSRGGPELLGFVDLEDFVSFNAAEFVQKGTWWAAHLSELAKLRPQLRERLRTSAMGQPDLITQGVQRAFRTMWKNWCAGVPPQSFKAE